jgi:hypothetical protein
MSTILIEGGTVVTVDDTGQVFDPGYVFIAGDRIAPRRSQIADRLSPID